MAEEQEVQEQQTQAPAFDEAKFAEMIKQNVSTSVKDILAEQAKQQQMPQQPVQQERVEEPQKDWLDELLEPKLQGRMHQANLAAQIAQDKVDFYSGDFWLEEVREHLTADDPDEQRKELKELRDEIEKNFELAIKTGKNLPRADIAKWVLGDKMTKDRVKYQESIGRRSRKKAEADLLQARRAVDISSGSVSNFSPADIHKMSTEKMLEEFGSVQF